MTSQEGLELRGNIKFCIEIGETPTDTYKKLQRTRGENADSRALVFKWFRRFSEGRKSLEDDEGRGRRSSVKPSDVTSIEDIIKEYTRMTVREISEVTGMSYKTTHTIITKTLNMRKEIYVHGRWVPRHLTDVEMNKRVQESRRLLRRFISNPDFPNSLITTDETWLYLRDPEILGTVCCLEASMVATSTAGKQMYMMFADCRGMLICHAVSIGTTINVDYYSKVLNRDLIRALREKRNDIPVERFILHHDNASSHTAASIQLTIGVIGFELLSHPQYSPDHAPFDFSVFPDLKRQLKVQRFENLEKLQSATNTLIRQHPAEYIPGITGKILLSVA